MVVSTSSSAEVVVAAPIEAPTLAVDSATDASISDYLESGERVSTLMGIGWKLGVALMVLVALAWAFGLLPGAYKLF